MNYRNLKQFSSGNSTDWDKFIVKIRWIFVCAKFFSLSNWSIRFFYLLVNHKPLNIIHWKYIVRVKKNTKKKLALFENATIAKKCVLYETFRSKYNNFIGIALQYAELLWSSPKYTNGSVRWHSSISRHQQKYKQESKSFATIKSAGWLSRSHTMNCILN